MRVFGRIVIGAAVIGGVAIGAHQAQATPTLTALQTGTVAQQTTTFNTSLSFFKFNPALGTLTDVYITLNGNVVATLKMESLDASPATLTMTDVATETLTGLSGTLNLAQALPTAQLSFGASAFDGNIDFAGTSGKEQSGITGSASSGALDITATTTQVLVPGGNPLSVNGAAALSAFTGMGPTDTITLSLGAMSNASATGTGNIVSQAATQASGTLSLQYGYTPAVPEPASMTLLGAGLVGLGAIARRRRAAKA